MDQHQFINLLTEKTKRGFDTIYDLYSENIYSYILDITGDNKSAEIFLQKTFLKIWSEPPVINLYTNPYIWLLQKVSCIMLEDSENDGVQMHQKMIEHVRKIKECKSGVGLLLPKYMNIRINENYIVPKQLL